MNIQSLANAVKWFTCAMADVRAMRTLSRIDQPHTALVCFHCQQAAELLLKGVLAFHDQEPPKTHHIALLLRLVKSHSALLKDLPTDLSLLTVYAADNQTSAAEEPTKEEMDKAVSLVESLVVSLNKALYPVPA